jgi:hypothetical protein
MAGLFGKTRGRPKGSLNKNRKIREVKPVDPNMKFRRRYPWDEWMVEGNEVTVLKGEGFNGRSSSFALIARKAAKERGYTLRVRINGEETVVMFKVERSK